MLDKVFFRLIIIFFSLFMDFYLGLIFFIEFN